MTIQGLWLLLAFQVKHFICDYPLQTEFMLGKFKRAPDYYWPLTAHCAVQAAGTWVLLGIYCSVTQHYIPGQLVLGLLVFDFVSHFIMDRIKASPDLLGRYKALSGNEFMALQYDPGNKGEPVPMALTFQAGEPVVLPISKQEAAKRKLHNKYFWWSLGLDQKIHHITSLLIAYWVLKY